MSHLIMQSGCANNPINPQEMPAEKRMIFISLTLQNISLSMMLIINVIAIKIISTYIKPSSTVTPKDVILKKHKTTSQDHLCSSPIINHAPNSAHEPRTIPKITILQ